MKVFKFSINRRTPCDNTKHYWTSLTLLLLVLGTALTVYLYKTDHFVSDQTPEYCAPYEQITCENGGLLEKTEEGYECSCKDDFYGVRCENERRRTPIAWLKRLIGNNANPSTGKPAMWWSFLPFTLDLQLKNVYKFHQNNLRRWRTFTGNENHGSEGLERDVTSTRILPPAHPVECTVSRVYQTPLTDVQKKFVRREHGATFRPDSKRRNIFLDTFYQYFVLQFFDTEFSLKVTASQVYGTDEITKNELRSFTGGKLKTEIHGDEHYPPTLSFVERAAIRLSLAMGSGRKSSVWFDRLMSSIGRTVVPKWTMGHPMLSTNPMFFVMSTLWVREHNRVCDVLQSVHTTWTDDQLYETAKNVVVGEMMRIMMNDVINVRSDHSLSLKYKPDLYREPLDNVDTVTTPFELLLTAMWPSGLPDDFNGEPMDSVFFSDNSHVRSYGIGNAVDFMVNQANGGITCNNYGDATEPMTGLMLKLMRENAVQSFNNYRRKLGLNPYKSFYDLAENEEIAEKLAEVYENVEDVELLTGMLTEKKKEGVLSTVNVMTNSFVISSILNNPLHSKDLWKPETFGGNEGFDIVQSANVETFVCNNLVDKCSDEFKVKLYANQTPTTNYLFLQDFTLYS